jgi:hypothetical protein
MSIPGDWVLGFDWGLTGHYFTEPLVFNVDGTFACGEITEFGRWVSQDGQIIFQFEGEERDGFRTTYSGVVEGKAMVGIIFGFSGTNGFWFALPNGMAPAKVVTERKQELTASGKPKR